MEARAASTCSPRVPTAREFLFLCEKANAVVYEAVDDVRACRFPV